MKTFLALAAALGVTVTAATACPYKNVSASVDQDMTVASIATGSSTQKPAEIVKDDETE